MIKCVSSRTVVIATGARYRRLETYGFERFELQNIHYAATAIEAARCRARDVLVVGAGNSAGQAAIHLATTAQHVHLVCRGSALGASMSDYLVQRVLASPRITTYLGSEIEALQGVEALDSVTIFQKKSRTRHQVEVSDMFVMIGAEPNTKWLPQLH